MNGSTLLVFTTNQTTDTGLGFDIDDAILSRCAAVFRFEMPTIERAKKLWVVQAKVLKVDLADTLVDRLADHFNLSGRSIRNLLKNSARWAKYRKEELTFEHFERCLKYLPVPESEGLRTKEKAQ